MEIDQLEQSVKNLKEIISEFPIGAISLDDFKPLEEKIETIRESLIQLNSRLMILKVKSKQYVNDSEPKYTKSEIENALEEISSEKIINARTIRLCLHSATILSILNNKEGSAEDKKKLYTYLNKLCILNDKIISTQMSIDKESQVQLDLKVECQKALKNYKHFLEEQDKLQNERLQKIHPEITRQKTKMEHTLKKINIMKKLIRSFIAASHYLLTKEPLLLKKLEEHRELLNIETILKLCQPETTEDITKEP